MPENDVLICISSNNEEFEKNLLDNKLHPEIKFVKDRNNTPYQVFFIDLQKDLSRISQNLIDTYGQCKQHDSKLAVVILHGEAIDIEKNHYFQKMLDDMGEDKPLHRLIFTKDIYQHFSSTPATPLDIYLYSAITERKINISQKGENLLFPLSHDDFINAIVKTLFLSATSGKNFWLLGDSIADLELAYLLKKNASITGQDDIEINAVKKNDPKTNSLLSIGNKTRAELNWQPDNEIVDDLKQIVELYADSPAVEETSHVKMNPIRQFLIWVYRPRPKKETQLPTLRKLGKKLLLAILVIYMILGVVFVSATSLSLQQLEKSVKQALNGNLNQSVTSLDNAMRLKEIGESTFAPIVPIANLIFPGGTEKIFNLFSFIDYSSSSLGNLHQTYVLAENLLLSLNNSKVEINYDDYSLALHSNLSQVYENLNQISFLTSGSKLPKILDNKIKENPEFKNLKNLEEQVVQFIKVTDIIPKVLSADKAKTILILLQNSQVLRPGGGEVDYYLLLTLNRGNLISKKYYGETELDKLYQDATTIVQKNKRYLAPPTPKLLDLVQDPDFSISSNNISMYLEKALKIKPDFIIATNDILIQELLLEEKSQTIDQFKLDLLSSSGSAVYKDLTDQYLDKLFNQNLSLPVLGRTIAKTIGDNQILLWSSDTNTEQLLASQSYSGVITLHPCNAGIASVEDCIAQTSYLSESAIQSSRENPWSSRLISHTINITSPSIQHEYQINYKPKDSQSPGFTISTIYHLYLPSPSTLDKVLLNELPASIKEVEKVVEGSFDYYKIPLSLNSDQDTSVVVQATTITSHTFSVPLSYSITE
ncbi:DUF4012 domain-containing protein, partial [bacterium]